MSLSRFAKVLCCVIFVLIGIICVATIIYSVCEIIMGNKLAVVFLLAAIIIPLMVFVFLFPIWALANIDINVVSIRRNIVGVEKESRIDNVFHEEISHLKNNSGEEKTEKRTREIDEELINFFYDRYNVKLNREDSVEEIKTKIFSIQNPITNTLKNRIEQRSEKNEVIADLRNHRAARK